MLTYVLKENSDPLYEQLYRALKRDILRGRLASGQKLPSKRTFAGNLGVSTITVQNAYEQLMSEGYVIAKPRQGFYVADLVITQALKPDKKRMQPIALPETPLFRALTSRMRVWIRRIFRFRCGQNYCVRRYPIGKRR